jgi:P27 family predicted phage terminase small subunit
MRGRKSIPTTLKILNGNPGKHALPDAEPEPEKGIGRAPSWMDDEAKRCWDRVRETAAPGLLTKDNWQPLVGLCVNWAAFVKSAKALQTADIADDPVTYRRLSASVTDHFDKYMKVCVEFGFTPSSRTRVHLGKQAKKDDLEDFLNAEQG